MDIEEFKMHLHAAKAELRVALNTNNNVGDVVMRFYNECCSRFEQETLIENLKEEFETYCLAKGGVA